MQDFPVFKTKIHGDNKTFDLSDPQKVKEYYQHKAGKEIQMIRDYLDKNTFVAYLLGKKNAGKGTYSKAFMEIFGKDKVAHISVGDVVRLVDEEMTDPKKKEDLISYLKQNYRGYHSLEDILASQSDRGIGKPLLPTEYILALLKREISRLGHKTVFIDGLPRTLDQVSYSLFFRELIGYREDPDFFILIQIPETVIDERLKYRRVCPICKTPRNLKLLVTKNVGFDNDIGEYYLQCDTPECNKAVMVTKEGDEQGIQLIKDRLDADEKLIDQAFQLYGVPKVLLRNSVPVDQADLVDKYELTPEFVLESGSDGQVKVSTKDWVIKDDKGVDSYSLMPQAVVVGMIKQVCEILGL